MRILLDECVPRTIKRLLTGHYVRSAQQAGFAGYKNGRLLTAAEEAFDLLITADKNLRYQQNLSGRKIAILLLSTNDRTIVGNNSNAILDALNTMQPADFRELVL